MALITILPTSSYRNAVQTFVQEFNTPIGLSLMPYMEKKSRTVYKKKCIMYTIVSFPDPTPTRGKGSGVLRAISWASRMQNSHVILIIVMATHCLVCGSRMQQHCGLICAAGALSHEKSHAVNLIGAPEIRIATSSSPRNRSKYTRPSSPCRGGVWDRDYVYN